MFRPRCSLFLLVFQIFPILQHYSRIFCLTFDNRLTVAANDCYRRVSIGWKLAEADVAVQTDVTSFTECQQNCFKYKNGCEAFSFGVGAKGNGSCLISARLPIFESFQAHPEYDVYARTRENSLWCDFNRLDDTFTRRDGNSSAKVRKTNKKGSPFAKLLLESLAFSRNKNGLANYGKIGIYDLFIDHGKYSLFEDNDRKVLDTVANKGERKAANPFVVICHRKLHPGKKMTGLFIERVVNCENLQDCCRACDYEKTFACKGFNLRRRADDLKCTCELSSTPYFRMDLHEDFLIDPRYDYYEKNDDCPPVRTISHSPASIQNNDRLTAPLNAWLHRENVNQQFFRDSSISTDYRDRPIIGISGQAQPTNSEFIRYPNEPAPNWFGEQLHRQQSYGFASSSNDFNWNRAWKSSQSRHSDVLHDNIVPNSAINYDEGYLPVKSSNFKFSKPDSGSGLAEVPNQDQHFYGKFDTYGSAFGYDNDHTSAAKVSDYEQHEELRGIEKCSVKAVSGSKLSRAVVRKACLAHSFQQCEHLCVHESSFSCKTFAYRFILLTTNPSNNCLLADRLYEDLHFYTDLEPNRDYDIYVLTSDDKICYSKMSKMSKMSKTRYPSEECFTRIRSGFTIPVDVTKRSMSVYDLGECQFACTASQEFVCRSLVFKYAMDHGWGETGETGETSERLPFNCFLTDWPSGEINPIDMPDMDGAELYERNTFPYGCETFPVSITIPSTTVSNDKGFPGPSATNVDELCYSEYHRPCKLMPHAVVSSMRAATKFDCRRKCSSMRNTATLPCMAFNYAVNVGDPEDNCFLSDIPIRDLRPNLDYVHDEDDNDNHRALYTWKDFDPYCRLTSSSFDIGTVNTTATDDKIRGAGPAFHSSVGTRNRNEWKNKFRSETHEYDYGHQSINGDGKPTLNSVAFQYGHPILDSNQLPSSLPSPSQRYTVNGYPCKNGTACQRNQIGGFWSCEIENERGSWDYCCEPSHRCGFSQGYHYPWCYVGSNQDQWRPCSETYYPYYFAGDHSTYRQKPLYAARHWPVIYFHETLPYNCSVDHPTNKHS